MSFSFKNNFYVFSILSLIYILISYWGQSQLVSSELFYNQFSDQISLKKANQVYELSKKFSVVGYILIPFLYAAKFLIIAAIIQTGIEIEELELSFANCSRIVMEGEIIFILPALIKIIWFGYYETNYNMDRLNDFSPISLYSIFVGMEVETYLKIALKAINLFELIYLFIITWLLSKKINKTFDFCLNFTLKYYGSSLFLWILLLTFLSL